MPTSQPPRPRAAPATPPKDSRLRLVLMLGALSAFAPLSIDMYLPALPTISRDFETGASEVQLTLSAFFFGLALGQAIIGPLSDAFGRRRPLLIGLAAYGLASLLCAFSPSVGALAGFRFVQGFAGAAGIVVARAIVRDLHTGVAAARFMSVLMLVSGLAPILAPIIGGQLLKVAPWQGIFVVLSAFSALLLLVIVRGFGETLPPERRQTDGLRGTLVAFRGLLTDRLFVGYALSCGLSLGSVFAYIAGSSFIFQEVYGVSPQAFSLIFGLNAVGLVIAGQVNGRLVGRVEPLKLLTWGLLASSLAGMTLLAVVLSGSRSIFAIVPPLFVIITSVGFVMPNATVLALAGSPRTAGSASALLGVLQFALGAAVAPLVGIAGSATALPMALVIAVLGASALAALLVLTRGVGSPLPAQARVAGVSEAQASR
jgi:DHA1 family bicyclomycin/chloramphenicol resistance-like MFS transporter